MKLAAWALSIAAAGCAARPAPAPAREPTPAAAAAAAAPSPATAVACDARQAAIGRDADGRAAPWSAARHLARHFPDGRVSWLMPEDKYQRYVVGAAAKKWGRCNATGCYVFAAPAAVIRAVVARSMRDGRHDPAALGKALGLPAASLEGTLRLMTLDVGATGTCVRLPVDDDPGAWRCRTAEDAACFRFGGYTSGGVPELMVIDAPVDRTAIEAVP